MPSWIQTADENLLCWIEKTLRVPVLDQFMIFYTNLGDVGFLFLAAAFIMLLFRNTRRAGGTALTAMTFGLIVTNLTVKPLISRARPWVVLEDFEVLVKSSDPNSFPSGHTCAAFAFAVAMCVSLPQKWGRAVALAAAVLMGFSRLYVGVHFPSDVLAGAVIGTLCGLIAGWVVPRFLEKLKSRQSSPPPRQKP